MAGEDRLGVELNALGRLSGVPQCHRYLALGRGRDRQEGGQRALVHHQRVVAGRLEGLWQAGQEDAAVVGGARPLAADGAGRGTASALAWCPRQPPSSGPLLPQARTTSTLIPASCGVHGPGEITTPAGPNEATCSADTSSLRTTSTRQPLAASMCARL